MGRKEYLIGGKKFVQKPLTLGQWQQLIDLLGRGFKVPANLSADGVVLLLSQMGLLCEALAVALERKRGPVASFFLAFVPPWYLRKNKNVKKLAGFLRREIDGPTTLEVVEDFFDLTRPIFDRVIGIAEKFRGKGAGSSAAPSPSPGATSPRETESSGPAPLEKAWPG